MGLDSASIRLAGHQEESAGTETLQPAVLRQKGVVHDLLVDAPHPWRERRFALTLEQLRSAFEKGGERCDTLLERLKATPSPLTNLTSQVVTALYSDRYLSPSIQYGEFQTHLRKALRLPTYIKAFESGFWNPEEGEAIRTLHRICHCLFAEIELGTFSTEVVEMLERAGEARRAHQLHDTKDTQQPLFVKDLLLSFPKTYLAIRSAPYNMKLPFIHQVHHMLKGRLNLSFDPYAQENLPYVLFQVALPNIKSRSKVVTALRLGSPTQEGPLATLFPAAAVIPEFRAFLQGLRSMGKVHVYFNLQHRRNRLVWANEAPRCQAIEQLQQEFPTTFYVITLAKNSPFYYQKGRFEEADCVQTFKEQFTKELLNRHGHYHFPESVAEATHFSFKEDIRQLLEETHWTYFQDVPFLDRDARCDFIEIFYTLLQEYLLVRLNADTYNATCRDGIDRAGGANALFYFYQMHKAGTLSSQETLTKLKTVLFAPALFVKKRAIMPSRLKRFISSALRLLEARPSEKPLLPIDG
jgi:hypothetical protein